MHPRSSKARIKDQRSKIKDRRSKIEDRKSTNKNRRSKTKDPRRSLHSQKSLSSNIQYRRISDTEHPTSDIGYLTKTTADVCTTFVGKLPIQQRWGLTIPKLKLTHIKKCPLHRGKCPLHRGKCLPISNMT